MMNATKTRKREHAKLSASGAERWLNCPKSVGLEEGLPDPSTIYSKEGTQMHETAEYVLEKILCNDWSAYNTLEDEYIREYIDYCLDVYDAKRLVYRDAIAMIETRVDYSAWVPEGFGTADFIAVGGSSIDVIDFKYGKGIPVSAVGNPQMRLYGLGALWMFDFIYNFELVRLHVIQPRIGNVSVEQLKKRELLHWGESIKDRARIAFKGGGEFNPGTWCRWCKVRSTCKARTSQMLSKLNAILNREE